MIKYFRHIRKQLLGEGKTAKYMKYAIGEILLVVIGILIALQINNWNTSNLEAKELNDYLLKVSENVSEDLIVANDNLDRRERLRNLSLQMIKHIGKAQLDSLNINKTIAVFVDFQFTSRRGGFQSLTNSSHIGKIKRSKLDSLLFQYYFNVEDLIREETSFNGFIESMEAEVNLEIPHLVFAQAYFGEPVDSVAIANITKDYFNNVAVQNATIRSAGQIQMITKYKSLIATGTELKEEIQTFVKSND